MESHHTLVHLHKYLAESGDGDDEALVSSKGLQIESSIITDVVALKSSGTQMKTLAEHLAKLIDCSPKTQREIARECGYSKPNIITMFKQGITKVPIEVVPRLAKALDEDPALLLRLAMREYMPEALMTIEEHLGRLPSLSPASGA